MIPSTLSLYQFFCFLSTSKRDKNPFFSPSFSLTIGVNCDTINKKQKVAQGAVFLLNQKGCDINMIGFIGAMGIEVEALQQKMLDKKEEVISGIRFVSGTLHGQRIVAAECGVGKVFAALCAQTMILHFHVSQIINTGVSGTLTDKLFIGQIAIADQVVQHDMDTTPLGDPPGLLSGIGQVKLACDREIVKKLEESVQKTGISYQIGTIASGDQFVHSSAQKEKITSLFGAISCEMEGAAIGQVCYVNKIPFGVLRAISDDADGNSPKDFPAFAARSAQTSLQVIDHYLQLPER